MSKPKAENKVKPNSKLTLEYNDLLERFLHFFISTLFSFLCFLIIPSLTPYTEFFFEPINIIFCLIMTVVSGLYYQAVLDFFYNQNTKKIFHSRVFVLWFVISMGLCFVFKMDFAPYFLIPAELIQFVITILLNRILIYQNAFLLQINEINGNELATQLRNDYDNVEKLNKSIDKNKILLCILGILVFVLTFNFFNFCEASNLLILRISILLCFILFYSSLFVIFVFYNVYQKNTYYAFLGFKTALSRKRSILKTVILILFLSMAIALVFSSNNNLLNFNIKQHEVKKATVSTYQVPEQPEWEPEPSIKAMQDALGRDMIVHPLAEFFWKFLIVVFIVGLSGLGIYFVWHFIFSETFFKLFTTNLIFQIIADFFKNVRKFFKQLFSHKSEPQEYTTVNSREFKHNIDFMIRKSKRNSKKKEELDRLTKKFMKIIFWGDKHGVKYKNTMAPGDYSELVQSYLKQNDSNKDNIAIRVGYIFEKALYSNELLTELEEKEFEEKVEIIINQ